MLRWIDDKRFVVGETKFISTGDEDWNNHRFLEYFLAVEPTSDRFPVWKPRASIIRYAELVRTLRPRNIFELGIAKGGSTAFLAAISEPAKMVAIDVAHDKGEALDEFLARSQLSKRVRAHYGVDQADRARLEAILDEEFGDAPLDLIIDDASHRLDPTRASFNTLFPRLRRGGMYVIEDWSWAHALDGIELRDMGPPLTTLLVEIVVACATFRDVIETVEVDWGTAYITKGPGVVGESFDVADRVR